ncbi:GNAT family N-acetyltransferase [Marinococcus halophilus]|uniref:GNAT family N-acetyltransferase n=1 Tax=Marinococcus halophilus TaxID=1371 RepID=UPI001FD53AA4|nr:GNAT family N-acetyltransferase [Marinococcus halophilus]
MFTYQIYEELYLKLLEPSDAPAIFSLTDNSREHLKEWLPWVDHTNEEKDTRAFIHEARLGWAEQKAVSDAIVFRESIIGVAGFNRLDQQNNLGEIGYWLGKDYQGKGIITAVTGALISYGFDQLGLNKIVIKVAAANAKSRA